MASNAWLRASAVLAVAVSVLCPAAGFAQKKDLASESKAEGLPSNAQVVQLYHGESSIDVLFDDNSPKPGIKGLANPLIFPQGTNVCMEVENAHPVLYTYSLDVVTDSAQPAVKGLSEFTKAVVASSGVGELASAALLFDETRGTQESWIEKYYKRLAGLRDTLKIAEDIVAASEIPESKEDAKHEREGDGKGFLWAKHKLQTDDRLKTLRDSSLSRSLDDLYKSSRSAAVDARKAKEPDRAKAEAIKDPSSDDNATLEGLKAIAEALVSSRDALFKAYEAGKPRWSDCRVVGKNPFTMSISAKRRVTGTARRYEGDKARSITVTPRYNWPLVEVAPTAMYIYSPNAPSFTVDNGVVRQDKDEFRWRAGTLLVVNALPIGEAADVNIGATVGLGWLDAKSSQPVDVLIGGVISVRNLLRFGVGAGSTSRPDRLKAPGVVDQPLPAGTKALDDLVVNRRRIGFFATLAVTGWSIKTPF